MRVDGGAKPHCRCSAARCAVCAVCSAVCNAVRGKHKHRQQNTKYMYITYIVHVVMSCICTHINVHAQKSQIIMRYEFVMVYIHLAICI